MKTIIRYLMAAGLSLIISPQQSSAVAIPVPGNSITMEKPREVKEGNEAKVLQDRLAAINAMDKSKLDRCEKKELRKEVLSIKKELRELSGGIYISAGALIVILILLIILT